MQENQNEYEKEVQKGILIRKKIVAAIVFIFLLIKFVIPFVGNIIEENKSKDKVVDTKSYPITTNSTNEATVKGIYLEIPETPFEVSSLNYSNKISTTYKITDIEYDANYNFVTNKCITTIYFSGIKTYDIKGDNNSAYDPISWKIYDVIDTSTVIDSGHLFPPDLCVGEKFEKETCTTFKLEKGREYKLVLYDE